MMYALYKVRNFLLGSKFRLHTNHVLLKYLIIKLMLGGMISRGFLYYQEYDSQVGFPSRKLNIGLEHLLHMTKRRDGGILKLNL